MKAAVKTLVDKCRLLILAIDKAMIERACIEVQLELNQQELLECQEALNLLYQRQSRSTLKPLTEMEPASNIGVQTFEQCPQPSPGLDETESLAIAFGNLKKVSESSFESLNDLGYLS